MIDKHNRLVWIKKFFPQTRFPSIESGFFFLKLQIQSAFHWTLPTLALSWRNCVNCCGTLRTESVTNVACQKFGSSNKGRDAWRDFASETAELDWWTHGSLRKVVKFAETASASGWRQQRSYDTTKPNVRYPTSSIRCLCNKASCACVRLAKEEKRVSQLSKLRFRFFVPLRASSRRNRWFSCGLITYDLLGGRDKPRHGSRKQNPALVVKTEEKSTFD